MFAFRFVMPDLTVMYHLACLSVCLPLCRDILRDILQSSVSDHRLSTVAHYVSLSLSLSLSLSMSLCVCVCVCVCVFVTSQVALVRDIAHALSDHTRRVRCDIAVSITIKNIMIIKTEVRSVAFVFVGACMKVTAAMAKTMINNLLQILDCISLLLVRSILVQFMQL